MHNVNIKVIFVDTPNGNSAASTLIRSYLPKRNNIKLYQANDATKELLKTYSKPEGSIVHFAIFDDDKFRFESVIEKFTAFGSFNDKKDAGNLLQKFNALVKTADPINNF